MAITPAYELTVDLLTIDRRDLAAMAVEVALETPRLVYPLGMPTETLIPSKLEALTNAQGIATFNLLPSSLVGNYTVTVGSFSRVIAMPAVDARLSELPDA